MSNFSLQLTINPEDLKIIKAAALNITLAREVYQEFNSQRAASVTSLPKLNWLVLDPFQFNTIEWGEEYSIYASCQIKISKKTVISKMSETNFPATSGTYYNFTAYSLFEGPLIGSKTQHYNSYKVNNIMPSNIYPALTFGLQQKASINGQNTDALLPLSAAVVPYNFPIEVTPLRSLYIWLQSPLTSGTVILGPPENSTKVVFESNNTQKKLTYAASLGRFVG